MKRRQDRTRRARVNPRLELTAMIDVVFLLLIFFIVATEPVDLLAGLEARSGKGPTTVAYPAIRIDVSRDGFVINGRRASLTFIDASLAKLARHSDQPCVLVTCTDDSSHSHLIRVLDLCEKAGLRNVSLAGH